MKQTEFTIATPPRTKKNSSTIGYKNGKYILLPSKAYKRYEAAAKPFLTDIIKLQVMSMNPPFNIEAVFYMDTRRRVDLVNLEQALNDCLVHYGIIEDDNCSIVQSMDGSRVLYDHDNPRTEVIISEVAE